jgi:hypothetical protein
MKKNFFISIFFYTFLLWSLNGCGRSDPKVVAQGFWEALKKGDVEASKPYIRAQDYEKAKESKKSKKMMENAEVTLGTVTSSTNDETLVQTTLVMAMGKENKSTTFQTLLIAEAGDWKVNVETTFNNFAAEMQKGMMGGMEGMMKGMEGMIKGGGMPEDFKKTLPPEVQALMGDPAEMNKKLQEMQEAMKKMQGTPEMEEGMKKMQEAMGNSKKRIEEAKRKALEEAEKAKEKETEDDGDDFEIEDVPTPPEDQ